MLYTIIDKRIISTDIYIKFLRETTESNTKRMGLFTFQIRITVTDRSRVAGVSKRIQKPNTRPADTHIIRCPQTLSRSQLVREHQGWNQIIKLSIKLLILIFIIRIHKCMLIANSRLSTEFFVLQLIAQISSQNILLMIILRTHILIILIFSGFIGQIIFTITFTSTKNILYTSFNAVYRIYRIGIVQLSRMLLCAGIIFKILVLQKIRNIQRILIIRIRFTVIGGMAKTIRESKKFSFLFKRMLIIHVAPHFAKARFIISQRTVTVNRITGMIRHLGISNPLIRKIASHQIHRKTDQIQSVNLITSFQTAKLKIAIALASSMRLQKFIFLRCEILTI